VYIGRIDPATVFPANNTVPTPTIVAKPLSVLDIGVQTCTLAVLCYNRIAGVGGGIGISANSHLGQATGISHTYTSSDPTPLPNINQQPPDYATFPTTNLVSGLSTAIAGVQVAAYKPSITSPMTDLLTLVAGALTAVTSAVDALIQNALSPLLDPLVNTLLASLGINLNQVDVGANLSCTAGQAALVI
jgi:hypothetical protein